MSLNGKEPFYRKLAENCSICAFRYPVIIIIRHFPSHSSKLLAAVLVLQFDYFPAALLYVSRALPMAWRVIMISVPGVVCAWVRRTVERNQRGDVVQLRHATAQIQNSRTWCSSKYEAASSHSLQYGLFEKRKTENTSEFPTEWWSVGVDLRLVFQNDGHDLKAESFYTLISVYPCVYRRIFRPNIMQYMHKQSDYL